MEAKILNKHTVTQMYKIRCFERDGEDQNEIRVVYQPVQVAPGLSTTFYIEIYAETPANAVFELGVHEKAFDTILTRPVYAKIVPAQVFRYVSRARRIQKLGIYKKGVEVLTKSHTAEESKGVHVDALPMPDSGFDDHSAPGKHQLVRSFSAVSLKSRQASVRSLHSSTGSGVFQQAMKSSSDARVVNDAEMDLYDAEDILELPLVPGVFFDPASGKLCMDTPLNEVLVNETWTVDISREKTEEGITGRLDVLEAEGVITDRLQTRMRAQFESHKARMAEKGGSKELAPFRIVQGMHTLLARRCLHVHSFIHLYCTCCP